MTVKGILLFTVFLLISACGNGIRSENAAAKRLTRNPKAGPEEWSRAIGKYEKVVRMKVDARQQQVHLYRRLGDHYLSRNMWRDALENYSEALRIMPGSAAVLYKQGLSLSQLFRFSPEGPEKAALLKETVSAYERALQADAGHVSALYALGILEFEFNGNPGRGIDLMRRILEKQAGHQGALFALGRFCYETGRYRESLEAYQKLEKLLKASEKLRQVRLNIGTVMERIHEGG